MEIYLTDPDYVEVDEDEIAENLELLDDENNQLDDADVPEEGRRNVPKRLQKRRCSRKRHLNKDYGISKRRNLNSMIAESESNDDVFLEDEEVKVTVRDLKETAKEVESYIPD